MHDPNYRRQIRIVFFVLFGFLVSGCVALICEFDRKIRDTLGPINEVSRYTEMRARARKHYLGETELFDHFPKAIPSNSFETHAFFQPRVYQGPLILELRLKLSPEEVLKIEEQSGAQSLPIHFDANQQLHDYRVPIDFTHEGTAQKLQPTFKIYFFTFEGISDGFNPPDFWNHGTTRGIAVSRETNEVFYWLDSW